MTWRVVALMWQTANHALDQAAVLKEADGQTCRAPGGFPGGVVVRLRTPVRSSSELLAEVVSAAMEITEEGEEDVRTPQLRGVIFNFPCVKIADLLVVYSGLICFDLGDLHCTLLFCSLSHAGGL